MSIIGTTLGRYRILEKLGQGGMEVVFKALDTQLERSMARKLLPPERIADAERKRRFVREARCASALNHLNIITIYEISQDAGVDYIAMEYVQGQTLTQWIPPGGLRTDQALKYAVQIAGALMKLKGLRVAARSSACQFLTLLRKVYLTA